jgi:transcriptional antiterminator RfaH
MKHWYVVYTQPRKELLACEHLTNQGFEVYFPQYLRRRSHARRIDHVSSPLFPRYIFVAFDIDQSQWSVIGSTRGVIGLVKNGIVPASVPSVVIEGLQDNQDNEGYVQPGKTLQLKQGAKVRVGSSSLSSCQAIFDAKRDEDRVFVLLSLLGREVRTEVPISEVFPLH